MSYPFQRVFEAHQAYEKIAKAIAGIFGLVSLGVAYWLSGQWQIVVIVALLWIGLLQAWALIHLNQELRESNKTVADLKQNKVDEPARINRERRKKLDEFWNRANILTAKLRESPKPSTENQIAVQRLIQECHQYADEHLPPGSKNTLTKALTPNENGEAMSVCGYEDTRSFLLDLHKLTLRIQEILNRLPQN